MEDKLTFTVPRPRPAKVKTDSALVRLTPEAYNAVEAISAHTGLSNCYVASQMILWAAERTETKFTDE